MDAEVKRRTAIHSCPVSLGSGINLLWLLLLTSSLCFVPPTASKSIEAITAQRPLYDGDILKSPNGIFALGFITHDEHGDRPERRAGSNRYLGIWYRNIPVFTVVWVANPDKPMDSSSTGILQIGPDGNLQVFDRDRVQQIWTSNASKGAATDRVARLNDTGNLVLMERSGGRDPLWESFDYPFDTLIRGMKLGWDRKSNQNRYIRAWDRAVNYSFDLDGVPQLLVRTNTSKVRVGFWDGVHFICRPILTSDPVFDFKYKEDNDEVSYSAVARNRSYFGRLKLDISGKLTRYVLEGQNWKEYWDYPAEWCDHYSRCGTYGVCKTEVTPCSCLPGFDLHAGKLNIGDMSNRCSRRTQLNCSGDDFVVARGLKLPDSRNATKWLGIELQECRQKCLESCSCTAYTPLNGTGCINWFGELLDMKEFAYGGLDLYIRVAAKETQKGFPRRLDSADSNRKDLTVALVIVAVFVGVLALTLVYNKKHFKVGVLTLGLRYYKKYLRRRKQKKQNKQGTVVLANMESAKEYELQSYPIMTITTATANFNNQNKLGQGAFGSVYRGKLPNGEQIAVKRLSKSSRQGPKEFFNEISLIAKLQHKNLVRLLGCCVHGEEKMLIYEFMPNSCLGYFIFDDEKSKSLDWKMRADIINGIARGVEYLHHGSRLRIVHRDLKVGNVLLDEKMNPKISDFGIAKTLEQDIIKDSTQHVVGTYGYMSPEYANNGIFSTKSDVYSFGVIVLEILTGLKNKVMPNRETTATLAVYAWELWNEGDMMKLVDDRIGHPCPTYILRYMHIALLCMQEEANDRPEMFEVIIMLGSDSVELPQPKMPGFFTIITSSPKVARLCMKQASATLTPFTHTDLQGR